jgi:hypothetical protein
MAAQVRVATVLTNIKTVERGLTAIKLGITNIICE